MFLKGPFSLPRLLVGTCGALYFAGAISALADPAPPAGAVFSKPVNINGVVFEAWVSQRKIAMPARDDQAFTLGLRVTNHTRKPLRFSAYDADMPLAKILRSDGRAVEVYRTNMRKAMPGPRATDYPLALPGRSIIIEETGTLGHNGKSWSLLAADEIGGLWRGDALRPGNYRLLLYYHPTQAIVRAAIPYSNKTVRLDNIWVGTVKTQYASFWLVAQ